jgi:hypothetical protein
MKAYGGVDIQIHIFLTSALAGGEWSASRPDRLTPGERAASTHWIGGWVDPRAGLDDVKKRKFLTLPRLELRPLGRPARSQSLHRLRYPSVGTVRNVAGCSLLGRIHETNRNRDSQHQQTSSRTVGRMSTARIMHKYARR